MNFDWSKAIFAKSSKNTNHLKTFDLLLLDRYVPKYVCRFPTTQPWNIIFTKHWNYRTSFGPKCIGYVISGYWVYSISSLLHLHIFGDVVCTYLHFIQPASYQPNAYHIVVVERMAI